MDSEGSRQIITTNLWRNLPVYAGQGLLCRSNGFRIYSIVPRPSHSHGLLVIFTSDWCGSILPMAACWAATTINDTVTACSGDLTENKCLFNETLHPGKTTESKAEIQENNKGSCTPHIGVWIQSPPWYTKVTVVWFVIPQMVRRNINPNAMASCDVLGEGTVKRTMGKKI